LATGKLATARVRLGRGDLITADEDPKVIGDARSVQDLGDAGAGSGEHIHT
jgi:hypothetical protein